MWCELTPLNASAEVLISALAADMQVWWVWKKTTHIGPHYCRKTDKDSSKAPVLTSHQSSRTSWMFVLGRCCHPVPKRILIAQICKSEESHNQNYIMRTSKRTSWTERASRTRDSCAVFRRCLSVAMDTCTAPISRLFIITFINPKAIRSHNIACFLNIPSVQ